MLSPARAYLSLVALTALNPATLITSAAVVIGRSQSEGDAAWPASRAVRGRRLCGIGRLATTAHRKRKSARPGAERSSRATRDLGLLSAHHAGPGRGVTAELSPTSPSSFSVAASRTQVARPSMAAATSSGEESSARS